MKLGHTGEKKQFDHGTLEQQMSAIERRIAKENAEAPNPWGVPTGFFKVQSSGGKDLGLGFYCPKCRLVVRCHAPHVIKHCETESQFPTGLSEFLRKLGLRTWRFPKTVLYF
jgi:hypothetical protein